MKDTVFFKLPPPILKDDYLSNLTLLTSRAITSNQWVASTLALFSRNDYKSIRIQTRLLEQWAAQPAENIRKKFSHFIKGFSIKLLSLMKQTKVTLHYRLLGMILLAALHEIKLEIDESTFVQLKNKFIDGSVPEDLQAFLFCLNTKQSSDVLTIICEILEAKNSWVRHKMLSYLNLLALKVDGKTLITLKPSILKALSDHEESVQDKAIQCIKTFILRLNAKSQLTLCLEILNELTNPSVVFKCLQSCASLLTTSNAQVIVSKLIAKLKESSHNNNLTDLIRCIAFFSSSMLESQQQEFIALINVKLDDKNRGVARDVLLAFYNLSKCVDGDLLLTLSQRVVEMLSDSDSFCRDLAVDKLITIAEQFSLSARLQQLLAHITDKLNNDKDTSRFVTQLKKLSSILNNGNMKHLAPKLIKALDEDKVCYFSLLTLADCLPKLELDTEVWANLLSKLITLLNNPQHCFAALRCVQAMPEKLIDDPLWLQIKSLVIKCLDESCNLTQKQAWQCISQFPAGFKDEASLLLKRVNEILDKAKLSSVYAAAIRCMTVFNSDLSQHERSSFANKLIIKLKDNWQYSHHDIEGPLKSIREMAWKYIASMAFELDDRDALRLGSILDGCNEINELANCLRAIACNLDSSQVKALILKVITAEKELTNYEHKLVSPLYLNVLAPLLTEQDLDEIIEYIVAIKDTGKRSRQLFVLYLNALLPILSVSQLEQIIPFIAQNLADNNICNNTLEQLAWLTSKIDIADYIDLSESLTKKLQNQSPIYEQRQVVDSSSLLLLNNVQGRIHVDDNLSIYGLYMKFFSEIHLKLKPCLGNEERCREVFSSAKAVSVGFC